MFWIALHCPLLSLESLRSTLGAADSGRPLVLVAAHRLVAVDTLGAERGLRPGMRRATALSLAPDLLAGEADPVRDAAALAGIAHAALAFTPMVVPEPPATVLLEVAASLRCFGGAARLLQRLLAAVQPLGHQLQVASAPTALGAALLARWQSGPAGFMLAPGDRLVALQAALDAAPLALLGPGREHHEALQAMGLHTLRDLRALPREGLARRFGAALLEDLDRALGLCPDLREPLLPPAVFESRLELFARADTTAQVLHGAGVLLARLVAWARARQVRIAAFTLRMHHESRHRGDAPPATPLRLELAEPELDLEQLQLLLRERLSRLELAAPTLEIELECQETVHAPAPNTELFPTRQAQAQGLVRLLERLRARLGDEQVLRLVPQGDHRPECATRLQPVDPGPALRRPASRRLTTRNVAGPAAVAGPPAHAATRPAALSIAGTGWPVAQAAARPRDLPATGTAARPAPRPAAGAAAPPSVPPVAGSDAGARSAAAPGAPDPAAEQAAAAFTAALLVRAAFVSPGARSRRAAVRRPVWLLAAPQPLAERGERPLWQGRALRVLAGPERIESGWWDGALAARDYFVAQAEDGALVWIYRARLPDDEAVEGWFLQGWFG